VKRKKFVRVITSAFCDRGVKRGEWWDCSGERGLTGSLQEKKGWHKLRKMAQQQDAWGNVLHRLEISENAGKKEKGGQRNQDLGGRTRGHVA